MEIIRKFSTSDDVKVVFIMLIIVFGILPTMLIKIIIEEPLPNPSSVISSADHIHSKEPTVKANTILKPKNRLQLKITGFIKKLATPKLSPIAQKDVKYLV